MRRDLFTIAVVDNIDHNPTSATAKDSFRGTVVTLMQHQTNTFSGIDENWDIVESTPSSTRTINVLLSTCTTIPPAAIKTKRFTVPPFEGPVTPTNLTTAFNAVANESKWLDTVSNAIKKGSLAENEWVSWSAYHASIQTMEIPPAAIIALLPLFVENAWSAYHASIQTMEIPPAAIIALLPLFVENVHSVAMIKYSMDVVKAAVDYLNPGQVPVLAADQPLFAFAKQIQWTWPATYGDQFVIMFEGLYMKIAVLKVSAVLI